mgnify:CR=1 FL=1
MRKNVKAVLVRVGSKSDQYAQLQEFEKKLVEAMNKEEQ